MKPFVL